MSHCYNHVIVAKNNVFCANNSDAATLKIAEDVVPRLPYNIHLTQTICGENIMKHGSIIFTVVISKLKTKSSYNGLYLS